MSEVGLAVISDFDGTLVDTREANAAAYRDAFASAGIAFNEALFDEAFGLAFDDMMAVVAPDAPTELRAEIGRLKALAYPVHLGLAHVNEGLVVLLRAMRRTGQRVALVTTARRVNVTAVLDHFGLLDLFDVTITAEDVRRGKPDPECYTTAARRLGVPASACVVFEDSSYGVRAARAAGCAVIEVAS